MLQYSNPKEMNIYRERESKYMRINKRGNEQLLRAPHHTALCFSVHFSLSTCLSNRPQQSREIGKMHSLLFLFSTLSTLSHALPLPPSPSMMQVGLNSALQPTLLNVTANPNTTLSASEWPPQPFHYRFKQNAYINILTYSTHDPPAVGSRDARQCLYRILDQIRDLQPDIRPLPSRIVFTKDFDEVSASVTFMMGDDSRTLRRIQARDVVEALIDLTRIYGVQGIERADVEVNGYVVGRMSLNYVH